MLGFLSIYFRTFGMFVGMIYLNPRIFPLRVKSAMALLIALVLSPLLIPHYFNKGSSWEILIADFVTGFMIGFIANFFLIGVSLAGSLMDVTSGFSLANMMDPVSGQRAAIFSQFLAFFFVALFFSTGGFWVMVASVKGSYAVIPPGVLSAFSPALLAQLLLRVTLWGLSLALPLVFVVLIAEISLGLINRGIGNVPIFVVWLPLRTLLALLLLILILRPMFLAMVNVLMREASFINSVMPMLGR